MESRMEKRFIVLNIKHKMKISVAESRMANRFMKFNSHRYDYDQIAKKDKLPSIEEFKSLCNEFVHSKKKLPLLQRILFGLSGGGRYITSFLKTEGALYAIVGCFTGANTKIQVEAGFGIVNLGLGSEEECFKVSTKLGAYLVANLTSSNPQMQVICALAIGNLCGSFSKICSLLRSQGFEGAIALLSPNCSPNVFKAICYALNHYLRTDPQRIKETVNESLIRAITSIVQDDSDTNSDIWWLFFIISTEKTLCGTLVKLGVVESAFWYLRKLMLDNTESDVTATTALVRILLNCSAASEEAVKLIIELSDITVMNKMIKPLLSSHHEHLRHETLQFLSNVMNGGFTFDAGEGILLQSAVKSALSSRFTL